MLTVEFIKKLKQNNISVNGELTKQRVKSLLREASRDQKTEIEALSGLKRTSINRVYTTGSISVKIALAMAQILNIDPNYLTGEADELGVCTEKTIVAFLAARGYSNIHPKTAKRAAKSEKIAKEKEPDDVSALTQNVPDLMDIPEKRTNNASDMTEEETALLLHSLFIKAKYSDESKHTLEHIKSLLA